ncbi:MAG: PAS domain-containing sensor histidine kinase [Nocardioidaceae bacterium]|nr:PAS domain-containing sensor histidine kinase [Nocardioidaceae bacterium]MCL2614831.1 PAS domain-containing sensor histidine kinase [Nocardioidaceae bacterium]
MAPEAIDLLPDGAVIADAEGRVVLVNRAAASMLDVDTGAVVGEKLGDVLALTDHDGCRWADAIDLYAGLAIRTGVGEQSWLLPDGTEVLVAVRLNRSERRGPIESVAVSLRSGRGRARLDRERSDLVATVAHELRSPLTGVKGFVHALLNRWDKLTDEQKRLMLTTVSVDADRLSRLIAELLDVARIDTGRLTLHRRPTDLALKAERVHASMAVSTAREIVLDVVERPMIDADPDKVVQVLTNVVENAVRHGDGRVCVRVGLAADDPGYAETVVTDEGEGIPAELRNRVFTKFWTSGSGGSGLGLYIVHGLMKAHNGLAIIDDAPGGGSRFTLRWPLADPAEQA